MASTYLYRSTDATASSGYSTTWTWSGWVKRSNIGSSEQGIFMNKKDSDNTASRFRMSFGSSDKLLWECKDSTNNDDNSFETNMLFRDTNAWYHIVFSYDTTQSTEADRLKLWVNGVDIRNDGGGFSSINEASNGFGTLWSSASKHFIGRTSNNSGTAHYFDGCMSHVHLTYGTTYTASTFGSTDSTTGEWKINTDPNVTYGSQGYFMLKNDNSVTDQSGQGNNFTASGTLTKSEDCPSNLFATLNILTRTTKGTVPTMSNGDTTAVNSNNSTSNGGVLATLASNSGKFYWEAKVVNNNHGIFGITLASNHPDQDAYGGVQNLSGSYAIYGNTGYKFVNGSGSSASFTFATDNILMCAIDLDNNYVYFGKNGVWYNSGDPTSGSSGTYAFSSFTNDFYLPFMANNNGSQASGFSFNFGNGYFGTTAVSSAGTNASNNGIFEYDVPTGYTALSTKGLNL